MAFEHVQSGEKWKPPTAFEWNAVMDSGRNSLAGQTAGRDGSGAISPQTCTLKVINKTGAGRDRYEAIALGEPRWELRSKDSLPEIVIEAEAADPAKPLGVLQVPLRVDAIGLAAISGPTLLRFDTFTGTGSQYAAAKSNHKFAPTGGPVRILSAVSDGYGLGIIGVVGSGLAIVPSGGIPGRTGEGTEGDPFVWGSADCQAVTVGTGEIETAELKIYNMVEVDIEPGLIQWKTIDGLPFVDVEQCGDEE